MSLSRDEHGAVAVMVALCLVPLLGLLALVIDLGDARQRSSQAQNSADFAALAGAGVLVDGTVPEARTEARAYVTRNDFSGSNAQVNSPPATGSRTTDASCIAVRVSEELATTFAGVLGIDTMSIAARAVACASPPMGGPYAVFAGSTTCLPAVSFSGANRNVTGGVHSNSEFKAPSSGTTINGGVTYIDGDPPSNITYNPSTDNPTRLDNPLPYPDFFDIADYAPGGAKATQAGSQYHYASGGIDEAWLTSNGLIDTATKTIAPGLYYTPADIKLSGHSFNGDGVTFVTSDGEIQLNGNDFVFSPWDPEGLLLFSNKVQNSCSAGQAVIKLNGNRHSWTGIIFAPNGPLDFSGTNITSSLSGRLVARTISLTGSSQTLTNNESYPGISGGYELAE